MKSGWGFISATPSTGLSWSKAPSRRRPTRRATSGTVYGYVYGGPAAIDRVDFDSLTHLAWHHVDMTATGNVYNESSWLTYGPDFVDAAHAVGVKVHLNLMPHPSDGSTARSKMVSVLTNEAYRARVVAEMTALVEEVGADGVSIDFEGLRASTKDEFTLFVQEMAASVDEVIVATPLAFGGGYDYDELAAASDGLFIMGYDAHWSGGNPGPVAMLEDGPLPGGGYWPYWDLQWSLNDYRTMGTPNDKIIMGLPLYGRSWPALSESIPGSSGGASSDRAWTMTGCRTSWTYTVSGTRAWERVPGCGPAPSRCGATRSSPSRSRSRGPWMKAFKAWASGRSDTRQARKTSGRWSMTTR